jgi:hypothetical protein
MQPGDLMMLGEGATLYDPLFTMATVSEARDGGLGEIVVIVREPVPHRPHSIVRVLHPTLGLRDVFARDLHPMTGGSHEVR